MSLSERGVSLVLSSTQLMAASGSSGRWSHIASTSPPRTSDDAPMPVRTTEQYCARLLTCSSSRPSICSRVTLSQVSGMSDNVSNL
jgi:hypothetical protein